MYRKTGTLAIMFVGLAILWAPSAALAQSTAPLTISIVASKQKFTSEDVQINISVTFTNISSEPLSMLRWGTPFDSLSRDFFRVFRGNTRVDYIGPVVKRGTPKQEDFIDFEPGESRSASVDAEDVYAISETGPYNVRYDGRELKLKSEGSDPSDIRVDPQRKGADPSNVATFVVESGRQLKGFAAAFEPKPKFENCSDTERQSVKEALLASMPMADQALENLKGVQNDDRPTNTRYKTWFGKFSAARYGLVIENFDEINVSLARPDVEFTCDSTTDAFAYVYPTRPFRIYLGTAFWRAPLTGTDSKAGTMIHEMAHFNIVAGTDDHAYGHENAKNLAIKTPARAVNNSDSHEYYAENTPPQ